MFQPINGFKVCFIDGNHPILVSPSVKVSVSIDFSRKLIGSRALLSKEIENPIVLVTNPAFCAASNSLSKEIEIPYHFGDKSRFLCGN